MSVCFLPRIDVGEPRSARGTGQQSREKQSGEANERGKGEEAVLDLRSLKTMMVLALDGGRVCGEGLVKSLIVDVDGVCGSWRSVKRMAMRFARGDGKGDTERGSA